MNLTQCNKLYEVVKKKIENLHNCHNCNCLFIPYIKELIEKKCMNICIHIYPYLCL